MPEEKSKKFRLRKEAVELGQASSAQEDQKENDPYSIATDPTAGRLPTRSFTNPQASDMEAVQAATGGTIGAMGGMLSGGAAPVVGGALGAMFPPRNVAEGGADAAGAATQIALDRIVPGSGTAAASLRSFLGKEGLKQTAKRAAIETGATGLSQIPLWAIGESDPGQAASLMLSSSAGPVALHGVARGLGAALGLVNPNDIAQALQRVRLRTGQFGKKFGVTAESGGRGLGMLEFFRGMPGTRSQETEFQQPLQELMMRGLNKVGAVGEVPMTREVRKAADEVGFVFEGRTMEEIQGKVLKNTTRKSIVEEAAQTIKNPPERNPLTGRMEAVEPTKIPAKKRAIAGGDIIAVDEETGRVFASRPDEALPDKMPDSVKIFKVDSQELKQLIGAAKRDPGGMATAIGKNNRNLPLVAALRKFLPESDWKQIQKDWLGQHLLADALIASSERQGGISLKKVLGEQAALDENTFMQIRGPALNQAWADIKSQKKLMMLEPEKIAAIDDIVRVVNELDIGVKEGVSRSEAVTSYGFNKIVFAGLSGGAVGSATGLTTAATGLVGGGAVMLSLGAAMTQALTNPEFARILRVAAKGDIDAARQGVRMMASNPNLMPVMHDENTVEFVPRAMQTVPLKITPEEPRKAAPPNLMERLRVR